MNDPFYSDETLAAINAEAFGGTDKCVFSLRRFSEPDLSMLLMGAAMDIKHPGKLDQVMSVFTEALGDYGPTAKENHDLAIWQGRLLAGFIVGMTRNGNKKAPCIFCRQPFILEPPGGKMAPMILIVPGTAPRSKSGGIVMAECPRCERKHRNRAVLDRALQETLNFLAPGIKVKIPMPGQFGHA